jgi:hypothetical protein
LSGTEAGFRVPLPKAQQFGIQFAVSISELFGPRLSRSDERRSINFHVLADPQPHPTEAYGINAARRFNLLSAPICEFSIHTYNPLMAKTTTLNEVAQLRETKSEIRLGDLEERVFGEPRRKPLASAVRSASAAWSLRSLGQL